MKNVYRQACLIFLLMGLLLSGCSHQKTTDKVLRVGLSADFAPFAFIEKGEIQGFDIDLMKEVARRLNKTVNFQDLPFETLIPELVTGKLDLIAGGMSPTPERAKRVLFSKVYLEGEPIIALAKSESPWIDSKHNLIGIERARIVVCMGYSSSDDYVTKTLHLEPIRLNHLMECLLALKSGQADLVIGPRLSLSPMIGKEPDAWRVHVFKSTQEKSALLMGLSQEALKKTIDTVLEEMDQEGTINILKAKWGIL